MNQLSQRVRAVVGLLVGGNLTAKQVIRIVMRVSRFERWGVRPITEARFRSLIQADLALSQAMDRAQVAADAQLVAAVTAKDLAARNTALYWLRVLGRSWQRRIRMLVVKYEYAAR